MTLAYVILGPILKCALGYLEINDSTHFIMASKVMACIYCPADLLNWLPPPHTIKSGQNTAAGV